MLGNIDNINSILIMDYKNIFLGYHQLPFMLLHHELNKIGYTSENPHPIRGSFWQLLTPQYYSRSEAIELLKKYLISIEREMKKIISRASLAYWLHLYRRLSPGPICRDKQPYTIGLTRAALEAAIQKYGTPSPCNRIGQTKDIDQAEIFCGLLQSPKFEFVRKHLESSPNQLVLTKFTHLELIEFYDLERLAYEVWRTGALLRIIGKGAPFKVGEPPEYIWDERSNELNELVVNFDKRHNTGTEVTSTGVYYQNEDATKEGFIFLPVYNLKNIMGEELNPFFGSLFQAQIPPEMKFNFIWIPFNIRSFRLSHLEFANTFEDKYRVSFDAVLSVIVSLAYRVIHLWITTNCSILLHYWQRAYEGPYEMEIIAKEIRKYLPKALEILQINNSEIGNLNLDAAIHFWDLASSKDIIDLAYSGPHSIFLPYNEVRRFIDYTWILRRLYDFFVGVNIPNQNFKGDALEIAVGRETSILPKGPCYSINGDKKQIDCAYAIENHLVIVECKAVNKSIAFDRGDPKALNYRREQVVERSISEIDEKANWLAKNPLGTNYDISNFDDILPIAVSPFVEFIHSTNRYYWISKEVPRVLTPQELKELLKNEVIINASFNRIQIIKNQS